MLVRPTPSLIAAFVGAVALAASYANAMEPNERLADAALEARARAISAELRCLVCQNQSIDDSNAPLARDLRLLVRERLQAGSSDSEVMRYLVERYGEFVLLKPRLSLQNSILWLAPFALLALVGGALWMRSRRQSGESEILERPLSPDEKARLEKILSDGSTN